MSATPRHDVDACPACRQALPARQALHRHDAMDHRPASDGAWLTEQIVNTSHTGDEPHRGGAGDGGRGVSTVPASRTPPTPAGRQAGGTSSGRVPSLLVLVLVGLVALTVPAELVIALALLMLAWACAPRRPRPSRSDGQRDDSHAPEV